MNYEALMNPALVEMPVFSRAFNITEIKKKFNLKQVTRMAANENQFGPSPKAVQAMREEAGRAFLYPDRQEELISVIAEKYGIEPENIMLNGGATGVINSIGDTFIVKGDEIIMSSCPYHQYPLVARRLQGTAVKVDLKEDLRHDLDKMLALITPKTKLIMICNPGNPTSVAEDPKELEKFIRAVPEQVLVMIDEAYLDFTSTPGYKKSMMSNVSAIPNLMVVRTFSKLYAMAGMRLGFVAADPRLIGCLQKGGTVSGVNRIAIAGGIAALRDEEFEKASFEACRTGKEFLAKKLKSYGWKVYPSDTNFLYFDTGLCIDGLLEELLKKGFIIRNFELNRISIGSMEQNTALAEALDEIVAGGNVPKRQPC